MFDMAINRWAFPSAMTYSEVFRLAKAAGFEAVEATTSEELTPDGPEQQVRRVAEAAREAEIKICGYATGDFWTYGLTLSDPEKRSRGMEIARKMLQQAVWLGTDAILYIPGWVSVPWNPQAEVVAYESAHERGLAALKELAPEAERLGVTLAVENVWNGMLTSPLEFREFIDAGGSPRVGAYFDTGNAVAFGFPEDWIRTLGKRICRVHVKDFRRSVGTLNGFVPPLEGDVEWAAVMKAFREVGYAGPLTAERAPARTALPTVLEQTRLALEAIRALA